MTVPNVIAIDAMGGDLGPEVVVSGAVAGARRFGIGLLLYGDSDRIHARLSSLDTDGLNVEVADTPDVIGMDEHPAQAVRRKPDSSLIRAILAVKNHEAAAMVSPGNSGAVMAGALMSLGRITGIARPAIASYMPSKGGRTLVLDLGAVTDPRPEHMVQFALMGETYAKYVLGVDNPTIGLLSNGEEAGKGNQLTVAVHKLLDDTPGIDFYGNVEGKDIGNGTVNIIVTDGFTGNVALKTAEGTALFVTDLLREHLTSSLWRRLLASALRPAFHEFRNRLDYAEIGGAPLLGVDGTTIICHGRSNEKAIENALGVAQRSSERDLPRRIAERVAMVPDIAAQDA